MYKVRVFYSEMDKAVEFANHLKEMGYEVTVNFEGFKYGQSVTTVEWW